MGSGVWRAGVVADERGSIVRRGAMRGGKIPSDGKEHEQPGGGVCFVRAVVSRGGKGSLAMSPSPRTRVSRSNVPPIPKLKL